jgi:hypothetical protein
LVALHIAWPLLCKRFASARKQGRFRVEYGVPWIKAFNDACNLLANYWNESLPVKKIVQRLQEQIRHRTKQIAVSVSNRCATNLFVMKSICDSKAAILEALSDSAWDELGGSKPSSVKDLFLENAKLWTQIESSIRFLQPFSELMHQIESHRPALGRCYEGLCMLDSHV